MYKTSSKLRRIARASVPLVAAALWCTSDLSAQSDPVPASVQVVDRRTGQPVPGVRVTVRPGGATTVTDSAGLFRLASAVGDSIALTHVGYLPLTLAVGPAVGPLELRITPRAAFTPLSEDHEQLRSAAEALAREVGGSIWRREEFDALVLGTRRVLDLLSYSGLIQSVEGGNVEDCVVVTPEAGCALIEIRTQDRRGSADPDAWSPAQVDSFVVLPAGVRLDYLRGLVVVFMVSG